ncbi:MAG TPA: shikimate dehydrogenase [Chloroflexi bacterium]|nr:shikimate dehydrogenase [Chloroflexota bacterium]
MGSFAFIIHPIDPKKDVGRKYPFLGKVLPESAVHFLSRFWPPVYLSHVTGARSEATGEELEGWLIAVPYTAQRMLQLPEREVTRKIIAAGRLAQSLGAQVLGLGAYTSIVGDGGVSVAQALDIPVTTGDSYTAAISVHATREAAAQLGIDLAQVRLAVVGASGAIGGVVARLLAPDVGQLLLVGRRREYLQTLAEELQPLTEVTLSTEVHDIREAQVVVTVTSAGGNLITPAMLRRGALVCDVSRPRDVSRQVAQARDDVLVIDGGLVKVPGPVDFGFDYGLPPDLTFGCIAETMTLAFENWQEDFTIGKNIEMAQVQQMDALAAKHGFRLAALRSFERKLDEGIIQQVKAKAQVYDHEVEKTIGGR